MTFIKEEMGFLIAMIFLFTHLTYLLSIELSIQRGSNSCLIHMISESRKMPV